MIYTLLYIYCIYINQCGKNRFMPLKLKTNQYSIIFWQILTHFADLHGRRRRWRRPACEPVQPAQKKWVKICQKIIDSWFVFSLSGVNRFMPHWFISWQDFQRATSKGEFHRTKCVGSGLSEWLSFACYIAWIYTSTKHDLYSPKESSFKNSTEGSHW